MDDKLTKWRRAGKHLPAFLRDFHKQKRVFQGMHEMLGPPSKDNPIRQPSWIEGQCYVIDCFLWFMARHGYTLQRSRCPQQFESLEDNLKALDAIRIEVLRKIAEGKPAAPDAP